MAYHNTQKKEETKRIYKDSELKEMHKEVVAHYLNERGHGDREAWLVAKGALNKKGEVIVARVGDGYAIPYEEFDNKWSQYTFWLERNGLGKQKALEQYDRMPEAQREVARSKKMKS
jgi:hypothetical protein